MLMCSVFVRLCEHVSESVYTDMKQRFSDLPFVFSDFWLIFFSILLAVLFLPFCDLAFCDCSG